MSKDFTVALERALRQALEYLNQVDHRPVGPTVSLEQLRARLCVEWNGEGIDASQVIDDLARDSGG